ncbi:hypothetical protein CHS0354_041811 [Potamilus streckersoni]|uniref:Major facilitator superfamily (MFS) profile domain-containing protein n=1 Tax=Potamilus streckersoni TaxID=2493646 RepID=A0AAE0T1P9_9BIVA|nr:hypothetical protein CHS0354_041811 [Potamilus streckersoni]
MIPDDCSKSMDTLVGKAGGFGFYQKRLFFVTGLMLMMCTGILSYMAFIPFQTSVKECVITRKLNETSLDLGQNVTLPFPATCQLLYKNDRNLESDWSFPEWTFADDDREIFRYIFCTRGGGLFFGFLIGAMLSDLFGRRRILFTFYMLMCVCQCLTAVYDTWIIFMVTQAFAGLFAGGYLVTSLVILLEYVGPDYRDACICLCPWWLGPGLVSLQAYFTRHWRYLALVSGGMGLLLTGAYFLMLESFRWLMCQHRFSESEAVIKELISCNGFGMEGMTQWCDIARTCVINNMHRKKYTYFDLFYSRKMSVWTGVVVYIGLVGAVVYSRLHRIVTNFAEDPYLSQGFIFAVDVPVVFSAVLINKCIGRRWCLFLYSVSSGCVACCILVLYFTSEFKIIPGMVTTLGFFSKLGVTATLSLACLITLEMYPTVVRTMGFAVGFLAAVLGYILEDQLYFIDTFHFTTQFLIYGALLVSMGLLALVFPDTSHDPLPDILKCRHRNLFTQERVRLANGWTS